MKKLTKEQADWLIEQLNNSPKTHYVNGIGEYLPWYLNIEYAERIINQCTEREFPEMKWGSEEQILDVTLGRKVAGVSIAEYKNTIRVAGDMNLSAQEFKEFTQGCNKIVEYLNEQTTN